MHNKIIQKLCHHGYEAYVAGGAVRDLLLGQNPNDYDIVTNAKPDEVENLFKQDYKVGIIGKAFKVCVVEGIEVATYRKDVYYGFHHRNCEVSFGKDVKEDMERRDLSINSMVLCPISGDVIDEFGGINDLKNRIIRLTGDPVARIKEDPCRIIRACRFLSNIDGKFDPDTLQALKDHSSFIRQYVAMERVQLEILKALKYKNASKFFYALQEIGVLVDIFPSLSYCYDHDGGPHHKETVFDHCMLAGDHITTKNPLLKLAGYLHDAGKVHAYNKEDRTFLRHEILGRNALRKELKRLKFSIKEISYICSLVRLHMRDLGVKTTPKATRRLIRKLNEHNLPIQDWLRLKIADRHGNLNKPDFTLRDIKRKMYKFDSVLNAKEPSAFAIKDLAINGNEVIKLLDVKPGPIIGKVLSSLFEMVLDDPSLNTKEQLIKIIETNYKEGNYE